MEYLRQTKTAFIFGALVLGISLLNNLKIEIYGLIAALASFLTLAIHDAGKKYLELTNQSETVKHAFGMIVSPLLAIVCLLSIFYVLTGELHWLFLSTALFIGFILFVVDAVPLIERIRKL